MPPPIEPNSTLLPEDSVVLPLKAAIPASFHTPWSLTNTGLPESAIRVVAGDVGGAFGSKVGLYSEEVVMLKLARRLGRPVTWTATRSEDLAATAHGRVIVQDVAIAASAEGKMLGLEVKLVSDVGAYVSPSGPGSAMGGATMYPGIYSRGCASAMHRSARHRGVAGAPARPR